MIDAFAITHTWPDLKNAEYEVVQRLVGAAEAIGQAVAVIDNNGRVIWSHECLNLVVGEELPPGSVRYILSLHFESPRVLDFYSYYALWQPIQFYYDFGYAQSLDKFGTHNDLLSCDSDVADGHALNLLAGYGREPLRPLPRMFHAPAGPYLEPNILETSKLFYIGINWERIGRPKGRFHDALVSLDEQGLTAIYGPQRILGVAPWEGFKTYQGELPFDGRSVLRAINRAGICLALSSEQHRAAGIMSNRLFEGLAGGAAVIATPNALIDKHFRDCVYLVDDSRGEDVLGQSIVEALREIREDRDEAVRRTREGQRILREVCSLEGSLLALSKQHEMRLAHFQDKVLAADARVTVILVDDYGNTDLIQKRIQDYAAQSRCTVDLHLVCDTVVAARLARTLSETGAVRTITVHALNLLPRVERFDGLRRVPARTGPKIQEILDAISTPFFAIVGLTDIPFSDHLSSLARALDDQADAMCAASGVIVQSRGADGQPQRALGASRLAQLSSILLVDGSFQSGRFLFRAGLAGRRWDALMSLLDGEEDRLFQLVALLDGGIAQTSYASTVSDETIGIVPRAVVEPPAVQRQYIRDRFASDPIWLKRLANGARLPDFVHAYAPGAPVRWQDFSIPAGVRPPLRVDNILPVCVGGPGLDYLGAGFAQPEASHVWLAADRGIIEFELDMTGLGAASSPTLVLLVSGRRSMISGREQHCAIILNGSSIAYQVVPEIFHEMHIAIPPYLMRSGSACRLELVPDHVEPAQPGEGISDERRLSISLMGIGLRSSQNLRLPIFEAGRSYACGVGEKGSEALVNGFYAPEPELCWIAGYSAEMTCVISGQVNNPALLLNLRVRGSETGEPQVLSVAVNNQRLGALLLPEGHHRILLSLAKIGQPALLRIVLALRHAEVTADRDGRILDGRLLGCGLVSLGVVDAADYADVQEETDRLFAPDGELLS